MKKLKNSMKLSQLRTTIEKNGERRKLIQTNVLVPKTNNMRNEEGATVAATPTFPSQLAVSLVRLQAGPAAFFHGNLHLQRESSINYRKCPTFDAKRRRFSDFN